VEAALSVRADAIHPGYGFLSEDPDFAEICADNGITFIGPSPQVLARLSDKAQARRVMAAAGLPVLAGSPDSVGGRNQAQEIADAVGYPVIVKAAAGGGGRGMRVVWNRRDFARAYHDCQTDAHAFFGDGRVYVERYLESARHIEVQVMCDAYGNGVHLGERDCTVQRRNQKLVEEAPAPDLPRGLSERIGEAAVQAALAVGYTGLGTFEFLMDPQGNYSFMEINCRIQVEHPVTEMVTGLDLVREQLCLAAGRPLGLRQCDIDLRGVAIECRINAEDPERGFRPTPGTVTDVYLPGGPFTRVDTHTYAGWTVAPSYDPLLAKLVVWAPDRPQAVARMARALSELRVEGAGLATTSDFLRRVLAHPLFQHAKHSTALVDQMTADGER
jgi:acetyl-CoA carboxylase biotin carboxylase subunit